MERKLRHSQKQEARRIEVEAHGNNWQQVHLRKERTWRGASGEEMAPARDRAQHGRSSALGNKAPSFWIQRAAPILVVKKFKENSGGTKRSDVDRKPSLYRKPLSSTQSLQSTSLNLQLLLSIYGAMLTSSTSTEHSTSWSLQKQIVDEAFSESGDHHCTVAQRNSL